MCASLFREGGGGEREVMDNGDPFPRLGCDIHAYKAACGCALPLLLLLPARTDRYLGTVTCPSEGGTEGPTNTQVRAATNTQVRAGQSATRVRAQLANT
jgi:hypothetical protein